MGRPNLTPVTAYNIAAVLVLGHGERDSRLEAVIMRDPSLATRYAAYVLHGPWREAESTIARDRLYAYRYAYNVLGLSHKRAQKWPDQS